MKRLIRKAYGEIDEPTLDTSNMKQLNELDEADIRHDRCPVCKNEPLSRDDGFKRCDTCGSIFKVFNGDGFIVS